MSSLPSAGTRQSAPPDAATIRIHLEHLISSATFQSTRRCRDLLVHITEKALRGDLDDLRERALGEDFFERPGYEPAEQNLVRVTANELRKRLAQYYDLHPDSPIRIELPRGSYVPIFHAQAEPHPEAPPAPRPRRRLRALGLGLAALAVVSSAAAWFWLNRPSPEDAFWKPVLAGSKPAVIWTSGWGAVMTSQMRDEILKHDGAKTPYTLRVNPDELIPIDQVTAYGHIYGIASIMSWLAERRQPAQLRLGSWFTPSDLKDRPLILFGALNNPWTIDLTRDLRYRVEGINNQCFITDKTDPTHRWSVPDYRKRGYDVTLDYALITRTIDSSSGQVRISIGGICHYSSQAGAEFLTTPKYWTQIDRIAPRNWEKMNLQIVLEVKVVEKVPQTPKAVAWHFW